MINIPQSVEFVNGFVVKSQTELVLGSRRAITKQLGRIPNFAARDSERASGWFSRGRRLAVLPGIPDWLKRKLCLLTGKRPSIDVSDDLIDCVLHKCGSQGHTSRQKLLI